jgi:hypothetical protein
MNETRLMFSLGTLKHFINNSLGLSYENNEITGFELIVSLLKSSAYNTYVETISDKADTLYRRIKASPLSMMEHAYLNHIKRTSEKFKLNEKEVILAFDYTDEDFYGEVQGFDIHGWTGENGVTGKFKFLTCSIISDEIPQKIPLISVPINIGHYKSHVVNHCLAMIKNYIGKINLILFDRGFFENELMYELTKMNYPFLIFVPKRKEYKEFLNGLEKGKTIVVHEYVINKNMSNTREEKFLAFLKEIYDPESKKNYDWIFATNVEEVVLGDILSEYKKRWRIETSFRVQDEARIKCKSADMKARYFFFLFEQMLQVIWICFYKDEATFKEFLIAMSDMSLKWTKNKEQSS